MWSCHGCPSHSRKILNDYMWLIYATWSGILWPLATSLGPHFLVHTLFCHSVIPWIYQALSCPSKPLTAAVRLPSPTLQCGFPGLLQQSVSSEAFLIGWGGGVSSHSPYSPYSALVFSEACISCDVFTCLLFISCVLSLDSKFHEAGAFFFHHYFPSV